MKKIFDGNQRIIILQSLQSDNDYSLNNGILQRILNEFGHGVGLAKTEEQLEWLRGKGLVAVERLNKDICVARLTRKGLDVAEGHELVEGVDRPGPK